MKVALYHPWIYLRGGAERVIAELVGRSRHDYVIFTNHFESGNTFPEFKKFRVVDLGGISVKRDFLHLSEAAVKIASQKIDLRGFDCLVVSTAGFGEFITLRNRNIPTVCYCHTPLRVIHDAEYQKEFFRRNPAVRVPFPAFRAVYTALEKTAWKNISKVLANSGEVKKRIVAAGLFPASKIEVIHPGIDLKKVHPGRKSGNYFLVPGRIMWSKNIELTIEAFRRFSRENKFRKFELVVAGAVDEKSKPYVGKLKRLSESMAVQFVICPTDRELKLLYRGCYSVLFPALNEDWGIIPIEAMAFAKPVIALDQGGPRESIIDGKTGFLVQNDAVSFAYAMKKLAESPSLAKKLGSAGRRRAAKFDWSVFAKHFDAALDKAVLK